MTNLVNILVICATGFVFANAVPAFDNRDNEVLPQESTWTRIGREYGKCMNTPDAMNCLAVKTVTAMQRASRFNSVDVLPGVSLVRNTPYTSRDGKSISENEIEETLPKSFAEKSTKLIDMLVESASNFLQTHTIQVKLPADTTQELGRALEEGRKKMKKMKMMGPMMMMLGAKLMLLMPFLLIGTKLLAIKALVIAKIALILALVGSAGSLGSLFSKGGSGGGGSSSGGSGWSSSYAPSGSSGWSSGGGGPYRRSMTADAPVVDPQEMAYSAQKAL